MGNQDRKLSTFIVATLILASPGLAAVAEQEPEAPFKDTIEVKEVLLDVVVTDEDGNVIVGLDKGDFRIEEEGREVEIESASFYSSRQLLEPIFEPGEAPQPESSSSPQDSPPEDRYFVLLYFRPLVGSQGDNRLYLRLPEAGKKSFEWVVQELLPNDHVAVVGFDTALRLHHDFTRDRSRLGRAIERASRGKAPDGRWPSRTEAPEEGITLTSLPLGDELRDETPDIYQALKMLAKGLGNVRGRKNIILFGVDFPGENSRRARTDFREMIEALNRRNVAVYSIAVTGRGRQENLDQLAQETGGQHLFSFRNFLDPLRNIARQNSGYYLLSFRSEHPAGESGYRELAVSTTNEEFEARARGGYSFGD
ncbi:MAG: VWA domain-containing protein [Deltaproteobacteria bacterium]|nr:VWA domain-containing protein [Deltaproteobacteria bacterium]